MESLTLSAAQVHQPGTENATLLSDENHNLGKDRESFSNEPIQILISPAQSLSHPSSAEPVEQRCTDIGPVPT